MAPCKFFSALVLLFAFVQCSLGDSSYDDLIAAELYAPQWEIESMPAADPSTASTLVMDYGFKDQKQAQLVFFGDSITNFGFTGPGDLANQFKLGPDYQGWALQLNDTLGHAGAMVNMAFKAGTNTKGFNQSLTLLLEQMKPIAQDIALVNLAFGANDAVMHPGWLSPPGVYAEVLSRAIAGLQEIGVKNIMLTTPPPVGYRHPTGPDRLNEWTYYYPMALYRIGKQLKVPVANIYDALMKPADWRKTVLLVDQLHLTQLGNNIVHEVIWDTIQRNFPDVSAAGLPVWYERQHQRN